MDDLIKKEDELSFEAESEEPPPDDLVAFNELRSCADLHRMCSESQLEIDPDFQRGDTWKPADRTRFIDSLAKQLPIPSMCISLDAKTGLRQVVDGRQRISSIVSFLSNEKWLLSNLKDIDPLLANKTVSTIKANNPQIYTTVQNATIPITVLRCDLSLESHREYLFMVFHRLNAGGKRLSNQEIRNCIYTGPLNDFLKEIVQDELFREVIGPQTKHYTQFRYEELVLRILSFIRDHSQYRGTMSKHLNEFMSQNRFMSDSWLESYRDLLKRTMHVLSDALSKTDSLKKDDFHKIGKTVVESVFVGIVRNIEQVESRESITNADLLQALLKDSIFNEGLSGNLAQKDKVLSRFNRAIEIFSD